MTLTGQFDEAKTTNGSVKNIVTFFMLQKLQANMTK